jgi:hypothetical protein
MEVMQYMDISNRIVLCVGSSCSPGRKTAADLGIIDRAVQLKSGIAICFIIALLGCGPLRAYGEYSEHDAHEHGIAHLNVVLEDENLVIEFVSPAANIVGFEHAAATEQEHKAIEQARMALMDGNSLFQFPSDAECVFEHATVATDFDHQTGEENETGHDHGHESGDHHSDADDHDDHDGHDDHGDFRAEYHFQVSRPVQLSYFEVRFMRMFPAIERLQVQLVTPSTQTAVELTADAARIDL